MKSLNFVIEETVGQIFEVIGQEVVLKVNVDTGILVHKTDSSIVVNRIILGLVELLKEGQLLQKQLEDKEELETVTVLRDMMVKVKEKAIVMEGEGRGEVEGGGLAHILIRDGGKVGQILK